MKHAVRKQIKNALAAIPPAEALRRSQSAAQRLAETPEWEAARTIMLYLTIPGEVDTQPIAHAAYAAGKRVAAPKSCPHTRHMRPALCETHSEDLFHPHHGLRQPVGSEVSVDELDLVIVPALAFDREGNRLGRGGGFYDRFLARRELRATCVGLAFAEQILSTLPISSNDLPVSAVVTDTEVIRPTPTP